MILRKDVVRLAGPIVAEQAFVKIMGVMNAIMAGRLGKEAVSAIGMVDAVNSIFIALFSALAVGGSVVIAHYAGGSDAKSCNEAARHAVFSGEILALAVTIVIYLSRNVLVRTLYGSADPEVLSNLFVYLDITLLTYPLIALTSIACGVLRGVGNTKTPMQVNIMMNFINVISSYLLIYGLNIRSAHFQIGFPGYGIRGAALGIALARAFGAGMVLYVLMRGTNQLKLEIRRDFRFDIELLRSIYGIGFPASVESLLFNAGKLITQIFIVGMGTASTAANYVVNSIAGLISIPSDALNVTATILVGQYMGRHESDEAKSTMLYIVKASSFCLLCIGFFVFPLSHPLASAFTDSREVVEISSVLIKMHVVAMITIHAFSFILPAGLKAAGDAKYTMKVSIFGMWAFRIVMGYVLGATLKMGIVGVWLGSYVDWVVRGILFYTRLQRGKWKENVVIRNRNESA